MAKQPSAKSKEKATKPTVISFRITADQEKILNEIQKRSPAVGIHSTRQLCRKIVADYIAGRLTYKNPADKERDLDRYPDA